MVMALKTSIDLSLRGSCNIQIFLADILKNGCLYFDKDFFSVKNYHGYGHDQHKSNGAGK
jgi:hypothetical protein